MGSEKTQSMFSARFWYACLAVGIIALSVVYTFSHKVTPESLQKDDHAY